MCYARISSLSRVYVQVREFPLKKGRRTIVVVHVWCDCSRARALSPREKRGGDNGKAGVRVRALCVPGRASVSARDECEKER